MVLFSDSVVPTDQDPRFVGKCEDPHVVELFIVPQTGRPELRLVPLPRS